MRFPSLRELDRDQKAIYNGAPPMETILVMGPPGTGKTVMAFHRAAVLSKMGVSPRVIMYNKVLARYTTAEDGAPVKDITVTTMHKWASGWWRRWSGANTNPPSMDGNTFQHDWVRILSAAISRLCHDGVNPDKVDWSHLIVDEGQDFPDEMYRALTSIATQVRELGGGSPALTVFADDNQRLNLGLNSSLEQITAALGVTKAEDRVFVLRKNYRNSRPIAEFAGHFQVGHTTGQAELPTRRGAKPMVSRASDIGPIRAYLATYAKNNPGKEIGVLCASDKLRKKIFNSLETRLSDSDVHVQTYSYADKEEHPADSLRFDEGDVVTVLNFQSAKGLEFDSVFIVDPFAAYQMGGAGEQAFKMQMYVMCSRAREYLDVILQAPAPVGMLPPEALYESRDIG